MKKATFALCTAAALAFACSGCAKNQDKCAGGGEACAMKEAAGGKCCGKCGGKDAKCSDAGKSTTDKTGN